MSFSSVVKHLRVLEKATLIIKKRRGKEKVIVANPDSIVEAVKHLERYKHHVNERFAALDNLLKQEEKDSPIRTSAISLLNKEKVYERN